MTLEVENPDPDPYSCLLSIPSAGIIAITAAFVALAVAIVIIIMARKKRHGKILPFAKPTTLKGTTQITDFCKRFGISESYFEPMQGDATTISSLLTEMEGHLPEKGSRFEFDGFVFEITDADENEVKTVKVRHKTN